jgi:hypothetical protein
MSGYAHVRNGSTTDLTALKPDFRFTPESRLRADIRACPKSANNGSRTHSILVATGEHLAAFGHSGSPARRNPSSYRERSALR